MIATYRKLQQQRAAGEIDGFTLIELLIVIVVLGTLAAVVIFALGGIVGQSAVAACQADGGTISTAMATFSSQNPSLTPNWTAPTGTVPAGSNMITGAAVGVPYIQSWPANLPHYEFGIFAGKLYVMTTPVGIVVLNSVTAVPAELYSGPSSCSGVL